MNVNALYCDDLAAYFTRLKETRKDPEIMPTEDAKADRAPTGAGWVVELRGFTYHDDRHRFVFDTLVSNLGNRQKKLAEDRRCGIIKAVKPDDGTITVNFVNDKNEPTGKDFSVTVTDKTKFTVILSDSTREATGKSGFKDKELKTGNLVSISSEGKEATEVKVGKLELEPVGGRVSHALIYKQKEVHEPKPGQFEIIKDSYVALLVGSVKSGEGGGAIGSRAGWKPLGGSAADVLKVGNLAAAEFKPDDDKKKTEQPPRAEFIIVFIWKEPTPSVKTTAEPVADKPPTKGPGNRGKKP
jgi:hypothetical protein